VSVIKRDSRASRAIQARLLGRLTDVQRRDYRALLPKQYAVRDYRDLSIACAKLVLGEPFGDVDAAIIRKYRP
jgi:hypothetical protein